MAFHYRHHARRGARRYQPPGARHYRSVFAAGSSSRVLFAGMSHVRARFQFELLGLSVLIFAPPGRRS